MSAYLQSSQSQGAPPSTLPTSALASGDLARTVAFDRHGDTALSTFFAHVRGLAATLPDLPFALNLCEDRYRFLVAFCAVAARGQATLLPPARTQAAIGDVRRLHPDSYCLGDTDPCGDNAPGIPRQHVRVAHDLPALAGSAPRIDPDALVAVGFTSGSTGRPTPSPKTWASFRTSTAQNLAALDDLWPDDGTRTIVATVPPQHMYGMELSVLLPLLGNAAVHRARPFFPQDIAQALHEASGSRLLVTTPVHLRALVDAAAQAQHVRLPSLAGIVSATAPLSQALAAAAEARFGCEVRELFGSTETCVIARRRTAREQAWTPLRGVGLQPRPDGTLVHAEHLAAPVALADLVDVHEDGRFQLRGRRSDLLEIAGKRASLADLTRRLLAIPGVEDGVVFQLDARDGDGVCRIAALAVAPTLQASAIRDAMRLAVDPVFLPRPLRCVAALPRNETGKLPRAALLRMLHGNID